jgi:thiamine-phosphate pyrophosphorylase
LPLPGQTSEAFTAQQVLRIIDVNLNRLREALRVIEEYYRFIQINRRCAASLKSMRHSLDMVEAGIGRKNLLAGRDTGTDPFAGKSHHEELCRTKTGDVLHANFKRGQEAARVIEEFLKVSSVPALSEKVKTVRFSLYSLEKRFPE